MMSFFNSLWNIKKWFTDKTEFFSLRGSTKRKHEECETINNKRVCMDDSLVEIVKISNESPSETDGVKITKLGSFIVHIRASPLVLIEGSQHVRSTMSPVITIDPNESNDDDVNINIIPSSNPQLPSNQNVSTKAIREEIFSIRGTKELNLSMESGFSALKNNDTSNNTDKNKSFAAMDLKYVASKSETKLLSVPSSGSPMNNHKKSILNQSKLSQTSGKKNLDISLYENRINKKQSFTEYLLRKYNKEVAAALFTFTATIQQKSPDKKN